MNTTFNHLINHRALTTFGPIETELKLQPEKNYLFDLSYLGILDVVGDKAGEFLQGQLTCDVNSISDIQMIQGAQCNLKGRILTLMDVLDWKGIKLMLPKDLLEATVKSLNKTALLSRVNLKENKELVVLGFYLQNPQDIVPDSHFFPNNLYAFTYGTGYCYFHLGNSFYIFIGESTFAEAVTQRFAEQQQLLGSLTWHSLRLAQRQFEIYPESRGLFLPHRLDLQQTPYLSFNKGCYKGQEIIARMHYKSTLKHQLSIYSIATDEDIYSGQKLVHETNGSELGELVDYSILGTGHYLVAVSALKGIEPVVLLEGHKKTVQLEEVPFQ
ncbi:MAG: folate-binding protein YgfZ [Legionella sp.]|uniref:CAF17-like 4Fe-4S cluster assembly/insertion protein YgfZ n=1 Tax=Legionella sp. TaxID=459 RepID=UPI0028461334|nr:folate-binding protein YgfZ [Legionella sp.]